MLNNVVYFGLVFAGVAIWLGLIRGKFELAPLRSRIQSPLGLVDIGLMFGCWFVSQVFALTATMVALGFGPDQLGDLSSHQELWLLFAVATGQLVFTVMGLTVIGLRYAHAPRIFGWQPEYFWQDLKIGFVGFAAIAPVIMTLQLVLTYYIDYEHSTLSLLEESQTAASIAITWYMAVFVAPITEEIFFRGILQSWLQRLDFRNFNAEAEHFVGGWTKWLPTKKRETELESPASYGNESVAAEQTNNRAAELASPVTEQALTKGEYRPVKITSDLPYRSQRSWVPIVISALIFAGVHLGQGPAPIPLFVFGLMLGYVYRETGSIVSCIVMHMLLNAISMLLFTVELLAQMG